MNFDLVIGLALIVLAHGFSTFLILNSRRRIEIIDRKGLETEREIKKEINHGAK